MFEFFGMKKKKTKEDDEAKKKSDATASAGDPDEKPQQLPYREVLNRNEQKQMDEALGETDGVTMLSKRRKKTRY